MNFLWITKTNLKNKINDKRHWQALYRIGVKHDDHTKISYPCGIKPVGSDYVAIL